MSEQPGPEHLEPYRQAVKRFGAGFAATLWGTEAAQHLRFDVFIALAEFTECTIVDAGCGRGDFAAHLLQRGVPFARYVGIDAMQPMVEAARQRDLDRCSFYAGDIVADPELIAQANPDWVCFSGTLNTMDDDTARGLIERSFDAASQGVVFNFLSDRAHTRWSGNDLGPARRFDTVRWIDWALACTSRVSFTQDYLDGHDATIMMRHD